MNTPITNNFLFDKLLYLLLIIKMRFTKVRVFPRLPARVWTKIFQKKFLFNEIVDFGYWQMFFFVPLHGFMFL